MDPFAPYEIGFDRLLKQLNSKYPRYPEVLVYQQRLQENISQTRKYGDTDTLKHSRAQIVDGLNQITQECLNMTFNEICGIKIGEDGDFSPVSTISTQPLIDIYSDREDWFNIHDPSHMTTLSNPSLRSHTSQEWLYSNLLPIEEHPAIIYSASSLYRSSDQVRALLHDTYKPPFIPKEKRLWTFSDLTQLDCPLRRACDVNQITQTDSTTWWHDDNHRLWLTDLYNQCLRRKCFSLGLLFDWQHNRFYFPPDGDRDRVIDYQASKRRARRRVAYSYRSSFWVHQAVQLSFVFIADQWYLKVEPAYTFTRDSVEFLDSRQVGPLATRRKARDYNQNVFNHLIFWREFLSSGREDIVLLCGDQQMVVSKYYERSRADFGILTDHTDLLDSEPLEPDIGEELFAESTEEDEGMYLEEDENDVAME